MKEYKYKDSPDIGYTAAVYIAMSGEQAIRQGCRQCLSPQFPDSKRVYGLLREIDGNLCISKCIGWKTVICLEKRKFDTVLRFLYPLGIPEGWNYKALLRLIDGRLVWIIGFDN